MRNKPKLTVVSHADYATQHPTKRSRSHEVQSVKMPGNNPAMVDISLFMAEMYDAVMVKRLGIALLKKLQEFRQDVQ